MDTSISFAVRSSFGISVNYGPPNYGVNEAATSVSSKTCRNMLFSSEGDYFVYVNELNLHLVKTDNWETIAVVKDTKAYHLAFSPNSTYLCTWEPFVTTPTNPQGNPNLRIYKCSTGECVKTFVQKKQTNWEPQWTNDEFLFSRLVNTDIVFYTDGNFDKIVHRISGFKTASFSVSPAVGNYFIACHIQSVSGQPALGRLFKYPNFENHQSIAHKSFFQADKVEYYWNAKGTYVLYLVMTEVDKTGSSYYGKQSLHFIGTNGQTAIITLSKEGPIYNVAWSPNAQEFCVVYGFMPSKAAIFNLKCEVVHDFASGARNSIYYSPHGNILILAGFGNLRGNVEVWDASVKKLIGTCEAPDSTILEWDPSGNHFLTATTAPRLRTGNGYKIWHYSGSLLFEKLCEQGEELYAVLWQGCPQNTFKEPVISKAKVESILPSQPQASKQAYRPPSARNLPIKQFNLHDDEEVAHKPGGIATPSKAALKLKKKRENRKARKQDEPEVSSPTSTNNVEITLTGDVEKDKKIKSIRKKLDAIAKLKEHQMLGKSLELNQLAKIKGESDLLAELNQLQL